MSCCFGLSSGSFFYTVFTCRSWPTFLMPARKSVARGKMEESQSLVWCLRGGEFCLWTTCSICHTIDVFPSKVSEHEHTLACATGPVRNRDTVYHILSPFFFPDNKEWTFLLWVYVQNGRGGGEKRKEERTSVMRLDDNIQIILWINKELRDKTFPKAAQRMYRDA